MQSFTIERLFDSLRILGAVLLAMLLTGAISSLAINIGYLMVSFELQWWTFPVAAVLVVTLTIVSTLSLSLISTLYWRTVGLKAVD